jgi:Rps23 Pro-64 3,4-dihydroxylase Tpa1-like proline 4-hydroxylase
LYGNGSTEISYTRFGPGAFLRRHVDEHHEELKGRAGWSQPTRRSISWLIYLNDADWNVRGRNDGGQLRCFQRAMDQPPFSHTVGARPNGDLQIAWLLASMWDPVERPVFLDGRRGHGKVAMYVVDDNDNGRVRYITKPFDAQPTLYIAGGEAIVKTVLMESRDLADRLHFIEPPKSKIGDLLAGWKRQQQQNYAGTGEDPGKDEVVADIDPIGGTLVVFDSVSLPHEVLATKTKDRWATSGWFHEDQQAAAIYEGHDRRRQV